MAKLFVLLSIVVAMISLATRPYIAPLAYQTISLSQAHKIWFWAFEGLPVFTIFAGLSIFGWFIGVLQKKVDFSVYKDKQNLLILGIFLLVIMSDIFSPFPEYFSGVRSTVVIEALTSIVIMYFISIGLFCNDRSLKAIVIILIVTLLYFIYWANSAYIEQDWSRFFQGRLKGLSNSQYKDGNLMSVVFVMGMPFILLSFVYLKNKALKYSLLLTLPLLWHAIFLFGSRGAMLSLTACTLLSMYFMKSKTINWGVAIGLALAFISQGGTLLERSETTISIANDPYLEEPLNPRLVSWNIGIDIMLEYPILGAGAQRFQTASAYLRPGESPHVAHNTLISIGANNGMIAAILYLLLLVGVYRSFISLNIEGVAEYPWHDYVNKASLIAVIGFFICSVFLDMLIFEPFYYMLIIVLVNKQLAIAKMKEHVGS